MRKISDVPQSCLSSRTLLVRNHSTREIFIQTHAKSEFGILQFATRPSRVRDVPKQNTLPTLYTLITRSLRIFIRKPTGQLYVASPYIAIRCLGYISMRILELPVKHSCDHDLAYEHRRRSKDVYPFLRGTCSADIPGGLARTRLAFVLTPYNTVRSEESKAANQPFYQNCNHDLLIVKKAIGKRVSKYASSLS